MHTTPRLRRILLGVTLASLSLGLAACDRPAEKPPVSSTSGAPTGSTTGGKPAKVITKSVELKREEREELQRYLKAGKAFGLKKSPMDCIDETIRMRAKHPERTPRHTGNASIFLSGCFQATKFPEELCQSVPPRPTSKAAYEQVVGWVKGQCATRKTDSGAPCLDAYMFVAGMCQDRKAPIK